MLSDCRAKRAVCPKTHEFSRLGRFLLHGFTLTRTAQCVSRAMRPGATTGDVQMKRLAFLAVLLLGNLCALSSPAAAQSVSQPAGQVVVASGKEWATTTFQDPIDMKQWTDLSWWAYAADQPGVYLSGVTYGACTGAASSSCFKATTTASYGSNFWILESGNPGAHLGRTGDNYPIDSTTYKVVAMRIRTDTGGQCPASSNWGDGTANASTSCHTSFLWNKGSLYDSPATTNQTNAIAANDGWGIYFIDLSTIGSNPSPGNTTVNWGSGSIGDLRYNLPATSGANVEVNWIRLVPNNLTNYTITWSGFSGNVDIYLDDNQTASDGNLGLIVKNGVNSTRRAYNVSGTSYTFQPRALAPGDYYVEICPTGADPTGGSCQYSPGYYRVNDIPTLTFTSPSPEGSADDFATVQLNQAWDMTSTSQVDYYQNVNNLTATTVNAVAEAGNSLGSVNVLQGTSPAADQVGNGDPYLYVLWYAGDGRGRYKKIDSSRYHILTVEMGLPDKARDMNGGSIARIVWQVAGEAPKENVSNDIIINSRAGANVMAKFTTSMRTCAPDVTEWNHCLRLETDPGASPSTSGWTGNIENFRLDPHEFGPATPFYIRRIKLAANEKTVNNQYAIQWNYTDSFVSTSPTLALYYDTDLDPSSGLTQIATGINPLTTSSYTWNTSSVPNGTYYIYASFSDGGPTNGTYSRWPIIVDSSNTVSALPQIELDRRRLDFGGSDNGRIVSLVQTVTVDIVGTGASSVGWKVSSSDPSVVVSPSSGTGTGTFTVAIQSSTIYPDNLVGDYYVKVEEATPGTTWNSAQYIRVFFTMYPKGGTQAPGGYFDTPGDGTTGMQGSFAVTGWALDDIGIDRVEIWRDPMPGETPGLVGPDHPAYGKIYIATPLFINGSRPDVEALFPTSPLSYRAGWGYLLLSWGLWNQGNATYKLYAYAWDKEGNSTLLGSKTITVDNNHANKPFGSIDVPAYGETMTPGPGGGFWNYGWALTPNHTPTCTITNGHVFMSLDSRPLVTVNYGALRDDIASIFPGFSNGNNAGGAFYIDANQISLSNARHQIGWLVYDDCGRVDGVGSRFFNFLNSGGAQAIASATSPEGPVLSQSNPAPSQTLLPPDAGRQQGRRAARPGPASRPARAAEGRQSRTAAVRTRPVARQEPMVSVPSEPVAVRQLNGEWQNVPRTPAGTHVIEVAQDGWIQVQLPGAGSAGYVGYQTVNGMRRELPVGSSLDSTTGIFYWQPGPGFLGSFDLLFAGGRGTGDPVKVRIVVGEPMRSAVLTPATGTTVAQPFELSAWAVDLAAEAGAGVDMVRVWAYPASGGKPIPLGTAASSPAGAELGAPAGALAYTLQVTGLPPGDYDLVVAPYRTRTGTVQGTQRIRATVR
jgi:hypothetical protein